MQHKLSSNQSTLSIVPIPDNAVVRNTDDSPLPFLLNSIITRPKNFQEFVKPYDMVYTKCNLSLTRYDKIFLDENRFHKSFKFSQINFESNLYCPAFEYVI